MTASPAMRSVADVVAGLGSAAVRPSVGVAVDQLGRPGSRHRIPTPALVVDADALAANIDAAQRGADMAGVRLRPHAKTHKSAAVARLQLDAGASGICVAKVGEAEALAGAGIDDLLVTSPIRPHLVERVADLRAAGVAVAVVADHPDVVPALAGAASTGAPLDVLVDVDVGLHRTGVAEARDSAALAELIAAQPELRFLGVQGYGGHWQHVADPAERADAVAAGMRRLVECIRAIEGTGLTIDRCSGGGTGTFAVDCELGVLNELQPGSYAFMDQQYADALDGDAAPWRQALFVQATVVSANHDGFVTVDAGLKAFATDAGHPGASPSTYRWFGDEHGLVTQPPDHELRLGDRLELVPPHCDPTVDRYDVLHVVRDDVLVDVVPIEARGCSQ